MALPKANRLKDKKDFDRVFKKGNAVKGNFLFIKILDNDSLVSRFGFIISAKLVPRAVARNRLKRVFSETARKYVKKWDKGSDVVVVLNKKGDEQLLMLEFSKLLSKTNDN